MDDVGSKIVSGEGLKDDLEDPLCYYYLPIYAYIDILIDSCPL